MKMSVAIVGLAMAGAGCVEPPDRATSDRAGSVPAPAPQNINWAEVDKSTARTKDRQKRQPSGTKTTTVTDQVERGYFPMSTEEYATALASATDEVKKTNPKWTDSEVETEATKRADEAKRKFENSYQTRASTTVKWSSSSPAPAAESAEAAR